APIRAGTDIVFLGALVNFVINSERWNTDPFFKEYVVNFSNAATLITPDYKDPEDLQGLFSGFDATKRRYDPQSWNYQREQKAESKPTGKEQTYAETIALSLPAKPKLDLSLQD